MPDLIRGGLAALLPIAFALAACGDDGSTMAPSCQAITDACHDVDPGSGPIHDCHETAHEDGTAAACDPIEAMCLALCNAAADGGAGGDAGIDAGGGGTDGGDGDGGS
jgi:hypothetical protein